MSSFLRDRRESRSISASELAEQLGVHPNSVLRWERRERLPGPSHIRGLARALAVEQAAVAGFFDEARLPRPAPPASLRGHGLRPLRYAARVPAHRIADTLGVPPASVYNWEAGRVRIPLTHLGPLAEALAVDTATLHQLLVAAPATVVSGRPAVVSELRALRRRTGLSQARVAVRIGSSRHSVSAWEGGQRPPLAAIRGLAVVYGVPVARVARAAGVAAPPLLDRRRWGPGDLPRVLQTLRRWSGLTQRQAADRCRCSVASIRAWESGRGTPRPASRARLERLYGLGDGALLRAYPATG